MNKIKTLLVEDDAGNRKIIRQELESECEIVEADNYQSALKLLNEELFEFALIDLDLGDLNDSHIGLKLIPKAIEKAIYSVVLSSENKNKIIDQAYDLGAKNYFLKNDKNALKNIHLKVISFLKEKDHFLLENFFKGLCDTKDVQFKNQIAQAIPLLSQNAPLFFTGPSGVGKTVLAKRFHEISKAEGNFVDVNCATLEGDMILSELFGHKKGAFTGAIEQRLGKLIIANNGTLFLDEIGRLPLKAQAMLLKALDQKRFTPLGSEKEEKSQFQLICASSQNLNKLVEDNLFLEDLAQRIQGKIIQIKPLSERKEDIFPALHFFTENQSLVFTKEAEEKIYQHPWSGNLRELKYFSTLLLNLIKQENIRRIGLNHLNQILRTENLNFTSETLLTNSIYQAALEFGAEAILKNIKVQMINKAKNDFGSTNAALIKLKLGRSNARYSKKNK